MENTFCGNSLVSSLLKSAGGTGQRGTMARSEKLVHQVIVRCESWSVVSEVELETET